MQSLTEKIKPFLKWAGGKGQLLPEIRKYYPFDDRIRKYAEPFVGGGAVLFDIMQNYDLDEVYISDANKDLIDVYCTIRDNADDLISLLSQMQADFVSYNHESRNTYYIKNRTRFNCIKFLEDEKSKIEKSALFIFLNKTCFNGLYRLNKKGLFNVPIGRYKNPLICDEFNINAISKRLHNMKIVCADYSLSADFVDDSTFIYFDPPYRPISKTSSFTSYNGESFDDDKQKALSNFISFVNSKGAKFLLSNSDPQNIDSEDIFFEQLYGAYNINKVKASRMINCAGNRRGKIKELLISNF